MASYKLTAKAMSVPAGLVLAVGTAMAVTGVGAAAAAWMILQGFLAETAAGYCAMTILLLSSVIGSTVAAGAIQRLRAQMCLAAGGGYYLCLMAVTALFFGGRYHGMGVTALMVFCGTASVILLTPGSKNKAGCRRRKKRH